MSGDKEAVAFEINADAAKMLSKIVDKYDLVRRLGYF